ncbi:MAG: hypothetical protein M3367_14100 [Acidobacteriota bacterium]|nr:hypothetical protein [Acidobacteriota bacterium]
MKSKFFLGNLIAFCSVVIFLSPAAIAAQANPEKTIDRYIEKIREDASEYKEARKIIYGDVDGDGVKDAVVQYTLEGAGGGNYWGQNLVVFLNKKGVYKMSADETVGGKFFRSFDLLKIVGKEIIGATETCPDDEPQGLCENPKKKQVKYVLLNGKLKEK